MKNKIMLLSIVLLSACAKDNSVTIDVPPPIINNITNEYITEEYYVTNVTEVTEVIYRNTGASIVALIHPCGLVGNNREVFLELSTGQIIALYDGGASLDRLVVLANGNYITTDNTGCKFSIVDGKVIGPNIFIERL